MLADRTRYAAFFRAMLVGGVYLPPSQFEAAFVSTAHTSSEIDRTLEIAERFPYCRIVSQENKGLSVARNVGAEAATGEIVAYTDSDCVADPDWLTYLVGKMVDGNLSACGGPNFPLRHSSDVPQPEDVYV